MARLTLITSPAAIDEFIEVVHRPAFHDLISSSDAAKLGDSQAPLIPGWSGKLKTLRFEVDRDIPEGILHAILRAARVTPEEFLARRIVERRYPDRTSKF